jgi:hypothetical protein
VKAINFAASTSFNTVAANDLKEHFVYEWVHQCQSKGIFLFIVVALIRNHFNPFESYSCMYTRTYRLDFGMC